MYQNPQYSDQAKRFREALASVGLNLGHSQALEKNAGVRIDLAAKAQAAAVMFDTLGKYVGRIDELLLRLESLQHLEPRELDEAFREIFRGDQAVVLSDGFAALSAEDVPKHFRSLVRKLSEQLQLLTQAPSPQEDAPLFTGPMFDWAVLDAPEELRPEQRAAYEVKVQRSGYQFYVDIAPRHDDPGALAGAKQLSLVIEINDGLPCLHMSNSLYGDQVLSVFSTEDGLYLRPESELRIQDGAPGSTVPALNAHWDRECAPFSAQAHRATANHAFIAASNKNI